MNCPKCGAIYIAEDVKCKKCGHVLHSIEGYYGLDQSSKGANDEVNIQYKSRWLLLLNAYQLLEKLLDNDIRMLVVEPAKGEYKQVFGNYSRIRIFTTEPDVYGSLRINPFAFPDNISVLSHIEKLMQIFSASWSLTAAMPALLKESLEIAYTKAGWDLDNSIWLGNEGKSKFPVFSDVLSVLPLLIDRSEYSAETKGNYKGALVTRVRSMTTGIAGQVFKDPEGISDRMLFDNNVIVDLSDIGSDETIALIMGILIMRLGEYHISQRKTNGGINNVPLKHVTVLEEAHNILKRTNKEQSDEGSNIVGKSVEMIANSIKEMRTYGEGFLIIDQSPMAVDSSAIENTSTKIIMNIPDKDACEIVSSALSLTDEQSAELAKLPTGVAATFQKGWLEPVLMKVSSDWTNTHGTALRESQHKEILRVRSRIVDELIHQFEEDKYDSLLLRKHIHDSILPIEQKDDLCMVVDQVDSILDNAHETYPQNVTLYGRALLKVLNCNAIFKIFTIFDLPISSQYLGNNAKDLNVVLPFDTYERSIQKKYQTRAQSMLNSLDHYAVFAREDKRIIAFRMMCEFKWAYMSMPQISIMSSCLRHMQNNIEAN